MSQMTINPTESRGETLKRRIERIERVIGVPQLIGSSKILDASIPKRVNAIILKMDEIEAACPKLIELNNLVKSSNLDLDTFQPPNLQEKATEIINAQQRLTEMSVLLGQIDKLKGNLEVKNLSEIDRMTLKLDEIERMHVAIKDSCRALQSEMDAIISSYAKSMHDINGKIVEWDRTLSDYESRISSGITDR